MSQFALGNVFLLVSMLCAASAQVILKALFNQIGPLKFEGALLAYVQSPELLGRAVVALTLMALGFVAWLLSLSRLDLSYAYTVACSSALFVSVFSVLFLDEAMSPRAWVGAAFIVCGALLLAPEAR